MGTERAPLSAEDQALLERLAARVVELRMEVPAILALESVRPVTVLASQALIFFEPMIQTLFRLSDYRRITLLLERRDVVETLVRRIEQRAEQEHGRRDRAKRDARARDASRNE
jgi:hypothetical protein